MRSLRLAFLGICLAVLFMASPFNVLAQPGDPVNGDPDTVPITGIEILIGLGGLLGIKKMRDLRKKQD
jgi:hypothetical protein